MIADGHTGSDLGVDEVRARGDFFADREKGCGGREQWASIPSTWDV